MIISIKMEENLVNNQLQTQRTFHKTLQENDLYTWIEAFLINCKVKSLSAGTIKFYQNKIRIFLNFCEAQLISDIAEINPAYCVNSSYICRTIIILAVCMLFTGQ
jgi:hypothetical protein